MKNLVSELLKFTEKERITLIAKDLQLRTDLYNSIDPHELAELVGITDAYQPGTAHNWNTFRCIQKFTLSEYLQVNDTFWTYKVVEKLKISLKKNRFHEIETNVTKQEKNGMTLDVSFLKNDEIQLISQELYEQELDERGLEVVSYFVPVNNNLNLEFEGIIEDDGTCLELFSPYSIRDGLNTDLTDCYCEAY